MNTSNNHSYDRWTIPSNEKEKEISHRYFQLQNLVREKINEDIQPGNGINKKKKIEEYRRKYQTLLGGLDRHPLISLITNGSPQIEVLPEKSWFLQLQFQLSTPLICRDDETFYIHDNPFHKDKVFKVPFYPASGWKGRLRWVAYKQWVEKGGDPEERFYLSLLFGDETGEEDGEKLSNYLDQSCPEAKEKYRLLLQDFYRMDKTKIDSDGETSTSLPHHAGWLYFYPSFFERMGLEVINPHSRKTKAGTVPIQIETVPAGEKGIFTILFAPTGTIAQKCSKVMVVRQLGLVVNAIEAMFRVYGFGAKTSSGFGAVNEKIDYHFTIKDNGINFERSIGLEGFLSLPQKVKQDLGLSEGGDCGNA
jgi:CRISPR/Cas system CMR subunit Cmr6 (Cas7 group RAMP superfamily)